MALLTMPSFKKRLLLCLLVIQAISFNANAQQSFPLPNELKADVKFWTRVYTEISTQEGFIHDSQHLSVIYERVSFTPGTSKAARQKIIDRKKKHYSKILQELSTGRIFRLTLAHKRVLRLWPSDTSSKQFIKAKDRLRFQLGQSNRFKDGLIRSGRWQPYIYNQFKELNIPKELASLPHVESSFLPHARSHAGAAGLWQFTRPTGRRYMRIDHIVDERLDPFIATRAAGLLLKNNYKITETWPLALTAYNHGAAGMRKATKIVGSTDISKIVREYKGRTFGFASRNFYNAFKAALAIDSNPQPYFGTIKRDAPIIINQVTLPSFYTAQGLKQAFSLKNNLFKSLNPALQAPVLNNAKLVPKGYPLRIQNNLTNGNVKIILAAIPNDEIRSNQTPDTLHKVRRGDSLSSISQRYHTKITTLIAMNNLRSRHKIRIGQILKLPASAPGNKIRTSHTFYTVKQGDHLSSIAKRAGVLEADIIALNRLRNRHHLLVGQRLRIRQDPLVKTLARESYKTNKKY